MTKPEKDDPVRFDKEDLAFLQEEKPERPGEIIYSGRNKCSFVVFVSGPDQGEAVPINKEKTIIGRDPACDVYINKNYVSKKHAEIITRDNEAIIVDYGSTNGTLVNERPINKAKLKDKDEIKIGKVIIKYFLIDLSQQDQTPPSQSDDEEEETPFYRQLVKVIKPYYGQMTTPYLSRLISVHIGKTPQTIMFADKKALTKWIKISTTLLLDENSAEKLADRIMSL
ncbi:MAG: FHA domain-containing protein [Desulfosudaceae bacterium]